MAEPNNLSSPSEAFPGTPGIKEIRFDTALDGSNLGQGHGAGESPRPGIRKVSLRAEIDTSPPFGSVKEAVTRFGGHGPWINPLYKFGDNYNGEEEFDIKKAEEQTTELEKDLIVKELETLDVLEELTTTKRIVEHLKRQLQNEAFHHREIKRTNNNNCPTASPPDSILAELKRAKLSLGKTIAELGAIQDSVECLTKKMRKEKELIEKSAKSNRCAGERMAASEFLLSEPDKVSFNFRVRIDEADDVVQPSKAAIMRKLREANDDVRFSRRALEEALGRVDLASKKQLAVEEALDRLWVVQPECCERKRHMVGYNSLRNVDLFRQNDRRRIDYRNSGDYSPISKVLVDHRINDDDGSNNVGPVPVLKTTVSMRDVLSKKQVSSDDYGARSNTNGQNETRKVALSDMLQALRDDLNFPRKAEKDQAMNIPVNHQDNHNNIDNHHHNHRKQFFATQRKKFGFIQISLPLTKPSKKKMVQQSL